MSERQPRSIKEGQHARDWTYRRFGGVDESPPKFVVGINGFAVQGKTVVEIVQHIEQGSESTDIA